MTEPTVIDDPLSGAVVRLRRVAVPEAPFAGWLARAGDSVVLMVDAQDLRGWPGWRFRGDHVLGVQDVSRTMSGHEAVLSWCVERVDTFLARREHDGADLGTGEIVTVAVSLIRGCSASHGEDLRGAWWLTQDGTPTFVCAAGGAGDPIGEAAGVLVDRIAGMAPVGSWRLRDLAAILRDGRDAGEAEAHLFAIAAPDPLVLAPLTPRRAADARRVSAVDVVEPERRNTFLGRLVGRHVDSAVGEMISDAVDSLRKRGARARRRVARPWLVAAGIAGVIVVGGLAWPTGSAPAANARPAVSASPTSSGDTVSADGVAAPQDADAVDEPEQVDPTAILQATLDSLATCADNACRAQFFEDASVQKPPPGAVDLPSVERRVELLDDLGGVAILSVSGIGGTAPTQLVVLVRTGDTWVIRDVRDVEAP